MKFKVISFIILSFLFCNVLSAQKKLVDSTTYREWRRIDSGELSADGRFVSYKYMFLDNEKENEKARNKYYFYDNKKQERFIIDNVSNMNFWAGGKWIVYNKEIKGVEKTVLVRLKDRKEIIWDRAGHPNTSSDLPIVSYYKNNNSDFVVMNVNQSDSIVYENVIRPSLYDGSTKIMYIKKGDNSYDLRSGSAMSTKNHKTIYSDKSKKINSYNLLAKSRKVRFEISENPTVKGVRNLIYYYDMNSCATKLVFNSNLFKLDSSKKIDYSVNILNNPNYIIFNATSANKVMEKELDESKRDKSFELELWSWNDSVTQSVQARGFSKERTLPYEYIYNVNSGKSYLASKGTYSNFRYSSSLTCAFTLMVDKYPYSRFSDWEHDQRVDLYLVNLETGENRIFAKKTLDNAKWSACGNYVVFWDYRAKAWKSLNPETFVINNLTKDIPFAVHDEKHDMPSPVPSYGLAAWTSDGKYMAVYDAYDIWLLDVAGKEKPKCYTKGLGRKNKQVIRLLNPNFTDVIIDLNKNQEVEAYQANSNKGFYTYTTSGKLIKNIEGNFHIRISKTSSDNETYLCIRQSFNDDRDLWITENNFKTFRKVTDVSPQKKDYKWGSVQQVEWTNYDGNQNKGLLYLPDGYKKGESYPAIVNFYETHSGDVHVFHAPYPSNAMLNISEYVSNGYIIFMPDVHFKIGEPAQSSYNAVVSGTKELIKRGIIDSKRVGLQGHSWSGYQTACLVTMTDMFTCVNIGAPIVNMTSGYNGIREGSGMPRMFMYEDWQCRMGKTIWDDKEAYIRNSPIFGADKITTPVLLFHCDKDGAVSFSEGRSLFLALRRLQRPCWMLNYKGEGHFVTSPAAVKDWTIRMRQFFEYYLNNTTIPRWMKEGISVNERGFDQKYDY